MVESNHEWHSPTPLINWIRKINVYETKNEYVIIGSNSSGSRFRILKVDRNEIDKLVIIDDEKEYNFSEISQIISKIMIANKKYKKISAFGIIGFVRFLEGYYLILILSRRRVAMIGAHSIYKIMDTAMFYIPNSSNKTNPSEIKYLKIFQNVDLNSNFYFSYSYDITHTLQYNLTPLKFYGEDLINKKVFDKFSLDSKFDCYCDTEIDGTLDSNQNLSKTNENNLKNINKCDKCNINKEYAIRTKPNFKFVWNEYLLEPANLHHDWLIYLIHGYVNQTILTRNLYLTLIARRSQKFAGTRFLKRGINQDGDVANEVETEQIVSEAHIISFTTGKFSSYVHIRGSVPSHWSQDISKIVPKPQITIDIVDPFSVAAGKHFNQLYSRYGSPIFVLNLVKMKEKRPQETLLTKELIHIISYLNQFLPPTFHIQYIGMDMARINKSKDKNVLQNLSLIAYKTIKKNGIFKSFKTESDSNFNLSNCTELGGFKMKDGRILQTGIVRVNCVDCLDRTNTAAFVLGKTALAFQLYALGLINDPLNVEKDYYFENKITKKLEELYEEHGDTLALQYGGSQLVHRIKTYKKKSHLSSQSRDFMQTISRYYSNTFSDSDKQNAINLFLGIFRAYYTINYFNSSQFFFLNQNNSISYNHIWDMTTDFYLHNIDTIKRHVFNSSRFYTKWWDEKMFLCLPRACNEVFKGLNSNINFLLRKKNKYLNSIDCKSNLKNLIYDESTDEYNEYHRCYEYTSFESLNYFELVRFLKEQNQSSSNREFNIFSSMLNNVRDTVLSHFKNSLSIQNELDQNLNANVSDDSSDDSLQGTDKIHVLNKYIELHDLTLKECNLNNKNFNDGFELLGCNSKNKIKKCYGSLFKNLSKTDLIIYEDYINCGLKSGDILIQSQNYLNKTKKESNMNSSNKEKTKKKIIVQSNQLNKKALNSNYSSDSSIDTSINTVDLSFDNYNNQIDLYNFNTIHLKEFSNQDLKLIHDHLDKESIWKVQCKDNQFYRDYLNISK